MWNKRKIPGFTLMELLATVAVMAVLAAGVSSLTGQGSKRFARDADRKTDLQTVISAMIMYRNDNSYYPQCPGAAASCYMDTVTGLTTTYIQTLPSDPSGGTRRYRYRPMTSAGAACNNAGAARCMTFNLCAGSEKDTTTDNDTTCGGACGSGTQHCVFVEKNP